MQTHILKATSLFAWLPGIALCLAGVALAAGGMAPTPALAQGQVYKCVNAAGATEFSQSPCGAGKTGDVVPVKPNTLDTSEQRQIMLRAENQALREELANARSGNNQGQQQQILMQEPSRLDSASCKAAQRDYDVTASSTGRTAAALQAKSTLMYAACNIREPERRTTVIRNR